MRNRSTSATARLLLAAGALALLSAAYSCSDPCQELTQKICSCHKDSVMRQRCNTIVSTMMETDAPSDSEQSRCDDVLSKWGSKDGCNCELALARNEACGFVGPGD